MNYIIFLPLFYFIYMFIFLAITKLTMRIADKYNGLTTNKLNSTTNSKNPRKAAEKSSPKSFKTATALPATRPHGYNLRSRKGPKHRPAFNGLMEI